MKRNKRWGIALSILAATPTGQAIASSDHIQEFIVTASPHDKRAGDIAGAFNVLDGNTLKREASSTLGETLQNQPGINSSSFGPGGGAPVIRGLGGKRVEILQNGSAVIDASDTSPDHAIGVEPLLADRIEILRGPATLRYGPGAIGGVVNIIDNAIHTEQLSGISGAAEARYNTNNHERALVGRLDGGNGPANFHLGGVFRESNDVKIPGWATNHRDEREDSHRGRIANSDTEADSWIVGAAWTTDRLVVGASANRMTNNYGIPPGGHDHHDHGHDHDEHHHDHGDHHDHDHEELTRIDMEQTVYQSKILLRELDGFIDRIRLDLNHTDYQHRELEIEDGVQEIGTRFDISSSELRSELTHSPVSDWRGSEWTGTLGLQHSRRDFRAEGLEAFVMPSDTIATGIYLIEETALGEGTLELGLRHDRQSVETRHLRDIDHNSFNASASLLYPVGDNQRLGLILSRSERAPVAEELLANGEHIATRSYEIGDARLDTESAWNIEASWAYQGDVEATVSIFHRRFQDFIYALDTGTRFSHHLEDDGLSGIAACSADFADFGGDPDAFSGAPACYLHTQQDARFTGAEVEIAFPLTDNQSLQLWGDLVRARFTHGDDVPRIPPARLGAHWDLTQGPWSARLSATYALDQQRAGVNQDSTDGYTRIDAYLSYSMDNWSLFLRGLNLTDQEIRQSTSFLRDLAPEPGRSFVLGARYEF